MVADAPQQTRPVTLEDVLNVVRSFYGVTLDELREPDRTADRARQRHVFMHLGRKLAGATLAEVAAVISRDDSTVSYGSQIIERQAATDRDLRYDLEVMTSEAITVAGARPPQMRVDPPTLKLYQECQVEVSRYVFGLVDLSAVLAQHNIPRHAWVASVACGMDSLRLQVRWAKDDDRG